jgi:hypothetical protein
VSVEASSRSSQKIWSSSLRKCTAGGGSPVSIVAKSLSSGRTSE